MSTTFYAGPAGNAAGFEIAFRENGGRVHWKTQYPDVCPCCARPLPPGEVVAHDEYGRNYTAEQLTEELGERTA